MTDDVLIFAEDDQSAVSTDVPSLLPWKVLIVDDEEEIHAVTKLALSDVSFSGHGLKFISAYSKKDAIKVLADHEDIAVALIDVVMEEDHSGLDLVQYIRKQRNDDFMRIILRTGQPGQAPERQVVQEFDINDYKEKTELTTQKLFSSVYTALGNYRALRDIEKNRQGLIKVIDASADVLANKSLQHFIQGVLEQISALLHLDRDSVFVRKVGVSAHDHHEEQVIMAATGADTAFVGLDPREVLPETVNADIQRVLESRKTLITKNQFIGYFESSTESEAVVYISSSAELSVPDKNLLEIFLRNVSIGLEHLHLQEEIEETQHEIVYMLGDAVETRSKETANHVRRVAEISRQLALLVGMDQREAKILHSAAPLHDVGKIGIPDSILGKPDALTDDEWTIMKTHAQRGADLLKRSHRPIMQSAATIALQHHENWDGTGYPNGLAGEDIHIYGRIVAIADVYDALGSKRCYKEAWSMQDTLDYMEQQKSKKFDPVLIDLLLQNHKRFAVIRELFPDQE